MRKIIIEEKLKKTLSKLASKDKITYESVLKKIEEITNIQDVNHYKNLRKPLQEFKRVHINKSFVLIFKCQENTVILYDFDHHDKIYL